MSLNNLKPTIWAGLLLKNLNDDHVYASALNTDYEGDIKSSGDTVKINSIGRVAISSYTPGSDHAVPETLDDSPEMLTITQSKMFNFLVDDVDVAQQKPKIMRDAMGEAAWGLADTVDAFLAALLVAGVASASPDNTLTAATSVGVGAGDDDAYELLVDLDVKLSESNVPRNARWVVIPPWFEGMLRKDPRFVSFGTPENLGKLKNGLIGTASGFEVKVSNNVPVSSSAYTIVAGYKGAATFAEQISKVEGFRPERRFADAMKGLHLYGALVTRPYALASVVATAA